MSELRRVRRLEAGDAHAHRVEPAEAVLDGAVLARRRPCPAGRRARARLCSAISIVASSAMRSARLAVRARAVCLVAQPEPSVGRMVAEVDLRARGDARGAGEILHGVGRYANRGLRVRDRCATSSTRLPNGSSANTRATPGRSASRRVGQPAASSRATSAASAWASRRRRAGCAFVAGAKGSLTPTWSCCCPQANQQPPRASSAAGFSSSGRPSRPP